MRQALQSNDIDQFIAILKSFFAGISYQVQSTKGTRKSPKEHYYQTIFYTVVKLLGYSSGVEIATNNGRIDSVIEYKDHIYIFEFKLDKTARETMDQIVDKDYALSYRHTEKKIMLIGINFDTTTRNIDDFVVKNDGIEE